MPLASKVRAVGCRSSPLLDSFGPGARPGLAEALEVSADLGKKGEIPGLFGGLYRKYTDEAKVVEEQTPGLRRAA